MKHAGIKYGDAM